jgi:hypothetical protein
VLQRPVELAQYTSFRFTAHLIESGIDASIGTVGDAYDNASQQLKPPRNPDRFNYSPRTVCGARLDGPARPS